MSLLWVNCILFNGQQEATSLVVKGYISLWESCPQCPFSLTSVKIFLFTLWAPSLTWGYIKDNMKFILQIIVIVGVRKDDYAHWVTSCLLLVISQWACDASISHSDPPKLFTFSFKTPTCWRQKLSARDNISLTTSLLWWVWVKVED